VANLFQALIGYGFAVLVGHFAVGSVVDRLWKSLAFPREDARRHPWHSALVGDVERALYVGALQFGAREFVGLWLVIKVLGGWSRWNRETEEKNGQGRGVPGWTYFHFFLIGNALSVAFGAVGFKLIEWSAGKDWIQLFAVPIALLLSAWAIRSYVSSRAQDAARPG
jgi:hypothetical protein